MCKLIDASRLRGVLAAAACALVLAVSALPVGAQDAPASTKEPEVYKLQVGDEVEVTVTPQMGYDSTGVVLPDGLLFLKVAPKGIKAVGLTIVGLREKVTEILVKELVDPEVAVRLLKMAPAPVKEPEKPKKVTIVGAVAKTGELELTPGLRLRKALDISGGTLPDADLSQIQIIHKDLTKTTVDLSKEEFVLSTAHNRVLEDGDSIEIRLLPARQGGLVRIAGQIAMPGQYELKPNMTLQDLIETAGKPTIIADFENIELRRIKREDGKALNAAATDTAPRVTEKVNLVERAQMGLDAKIPLLPGDEVFIPEQKDKVYVVGAVPNPGPRKVRPGQKVSDFFVFTPENNAALNGGQIDQDKVMLVRQGEKPKHIDLDAVVRKPERKDNFELQPGDVIVLPAKNQSTKQSPLQQLPYLGWIFSIF